MGAGYVCLDPGYSGYNAGVLPHEIGDLGERCSCFRGVRGEELKDVEALRLDRHVTTLDAGTVWSLT